MLLVATQVFRKIFKVQNEYVIIGIMASLLEKLVRGNEMR